MCAPFFRWPCCAEADSIADRTSVECGEVRSAPYGARLGVDKMGQSVTPSAFEHGGKAVVIGADAADGIIDRRAQGGLRRKVLDSVRRDLDKRGVTAANMRS